MRDVYKMLSTDDGERIQWDLTKRYASVSQMFQNYYYYLFIIIITLYLLLLEASDSFTYIM